MDLLKLEVGGDSFLIKYSPNAELIWTRMIATPQIDVGCAVTVCAEGFIYVTGYTGGWLKQYFGLYDIFLQKYDKDRNII